MPITVTILTPDRSLLEAEECREVELPGAGGRLGVLEGHTPLVTPLGIGEIRLYQSGPAPSRRIAAAGGFVEVTPEKVLVTARAAELADDIDADRARAAKRRAEQRLRKRGPDLDVERAEAALARALNRIRVAGTGHGE